MVRFARAEGSKGSNKKQFEDATPWAEIVSQLETSKKKRKKNQDVEDNEKKDGILGQVTKKKKEFDTGKQETRLQNASHSPFQTTDEQKNCKENGQPVPAVQNVVKKSKKGKNKGPKTSVPEYTINSDGKKVKVFRDGTARTWFDLPYEESDTMTRYDGMWVKKDMVEKLDCLKTALQEEGLDDKGIMRKMMKAKRTAHRNLRIELIYQQKNLVSEAAGEKKNYSGSKNKPLKKDKKKNQKQVVIGNGSLSSLNKGSSVQLKENLGKQLDEQSTTEQIYPEVEQMTGDDDGAQENDTKVGISQTSGKVHKRKRKDTVDGSKETPSQVNGNNRKEGQDCMTVLTTQDGKVKKKLKKGTLQTETEAKQMKVGDKDDDKMTMTLQTKSEAKKNIKSKKAKLTMEILPSQTNIENEGEDEEKSATQQESKQNKKGKNKIEIATPCSGNKKKKNDLETEMSQAPINTQQKTETAETFETLDHKTEAAETFETLYHETEAAETFETLYHKTEAAETFETLYHKTNKMDNATNSQGDFEENELMTNFEGFWVLRKDVEALEAVKEAELEAIYGVRTDESRGELTKEEKIRLQRAVKKRKRVYHKRLLQKLSASKRVMNNRKGKKDTENKDSGIVVKFDGFFVKKEAADRLHQLRSKLFKEGLSQQEVDTLIKKERRKEERVLKNERNLVCLNCRQPGHMVSACPNIAAADGEGQPSICYTCGSTEHMSSSCNLKKGSEKSFSFATCYICKESGHISRQCPDNPRGLYPRGGACRGCGSVEHLAKDCPDLQKENAEYTIKVGTMKGEELEALDEDDETGDQDVSPSPSKWTKRKVVKF